MGKIKKKGRVFYMLPQSLALILRIGTSGQAKNFMYVILIAHISSYSASCSLTGT